MAKRIIGIDIGGVIIDRSVSKVGTAEDTMFTARYLDTRPVAGAFAAIAALKQAGNGVVLISKCRKKIEQKTREWLHHHRFPELTGVGSGDWYFVETRAAKAPLADFLSVTDFIDDRLEVLFYMTKQRRLLFRPDEKEVSRALSRWTAVHAECVHADGGDPNHVCPSCERQADAPRPEFTIVASWAGALEYFRQPQLELT